MFMRNSDGLQREHVCNSDSAWISFKIFNLLSFTFNPFSQLILMLSSSLQDKEHYCSGSQAPKCFWSTTATLHILFLYSSNPREVRNFSRSYRKNRWEPVYSSGASAMSEWRNYPRHTKGSHTWFEKTNGVAVNSVGDWLVTIATSRLHSCVEYPKLICCLIRSRDRKESLTCSVVLMWELVIWNNPLAK